MLLLLVVQVKVLVVFLILRLLDFFAHFTEDLFAVLVVLLLVHRHHYFEIVVVNRLRVLPEIDLFLVTLHFFQRSQGRELAGARRTSNQHIASQGIGLAIH